MSVLAAYSNGICKFPVPVYSSDLSIAHPISYSEIQVKCIVTKMSYIELEEIGAPIGDYHQMIKVSGRFTTAPLPKIVYDSHVCTITLESGITGQMSYTTKISSPYYNEIGVLGLAFSGSIQIL